MPAPHADEKILAGRVLTAAAKHVTRDLGTFAGWLITGFAAAFGLLLANLDAIAGVISVESFRSAILVFLAAVVVHIMQRWIAAITLSSITAGEELEAIVIQSQASRDSIDGQIMLAELDRALYWPGRWVMRHMIAKVISGDIVAINRMQAKLSQILSYAAIVQMILLVIAAAIVAFGINS